MNKSEAKKVIAEELDAYRAKSYGELVELVGSPIAYEKAAASGSRYQVEIQVLWDSQPDGDIRIVGSVNDGGWRAFFPLTDDFVKSPSEEFVGE